MAHLIDKDALAAEIEKYISNYKEILNKIDKSSNEWVDSTLMLESKIDVLQHILSFLNTLEVKEVDLGLNSFDATVCKIGSTYLKEMDRDAIAKALESYKDGDKVKVIITT